MCFPSRKKLWLAISRRFLKYAREAKLVAELLTVRLAEAKRAGISVNDLFKAFDADQNGRISREEFQKVLRLVGFTPNEKVLDGLIARFAKDGSKEVECSAFVRFFEERIRTNTVTSAEEVIARQRTKRRRGTGFLSNINADSDDLIADASRATQQLAPILEALKQIKNEQQQDREDWKATTSSFFGATSVQLQEMLGQSEPEMDTGDVTAALAASADVSAGGINKAKSMAAAAAAAAATAAVIAATTTAGSATATLATAATTSGPARPTSPKPCSAAHPGNSVPASALVSPMGFDHGAGSMLLEKLGKMEEKVTTIAIALSGLREQNDTLKQQNEVLQHQVGSLSQLVSDNRKSLFPLGQMVLDSKTTLEGLSHRVHFNLQSAVSSAMGSSRAPASAIRTQQLLQSRRFSGASPGRPASAASARPASASASMTPTSKDDGGRAKRGGGGGGGGEGGASGRPEI